MRLRWSILAIGDREAIFDYIEALNPDAAVRVDDRIATAIMRLIDFPESGRPGRVDGTRELVISGTPYVAAYIVMLDAIRILRILHAAQQWPDEFPPS